MLITFVIILSEHLVSAQKTCKRATVDAEGIILHWPETLIGQLMSSSPLCIDKNDKILQRRCAENGSWEEFRSQKCAFYSNKNFTACPYGMEQLKLDDGDELCVSVTKPKKWKNSCLNLGATKSILDLSSNNFRDIVEHMKMVKNINEFWLPAKRYQDYNPFQFEVAGKLFGNALNFEDYGLDVLDNYKNACIKFVIDGSKTFLASENCDSSLPEVCIFEENSALQLACPHGMSSRYFYHQNKCFIVEKSVKLSRKTVFNASSFYSRKFIADLLESFNLDKNDRCLVNLDKIDTSKDGKFTVINRDGKWMVSDKFTCVIYEEDLEIQVPEIYLKYDTNAGKLLLIIYSEEFLWKDDANESGVKCFTIGDNELVKVAKVKSRLWYDRIKKYDLKLFDGQRMREISKSIYEVKMQGGGPGLYWCEGHAIYSFNLIKSKRIVTRKKLSGVIMAVELELNVQPKKDFVYDKDFLKSVTKQIKKSIKKCENLNRYEKAMSDNIQEIRIMKIVKFNKLLGQMTAIYHFTISNSDLNQSQSESKSETETEAYDEFMRKYADKFNEVKVIINHQLMSLLESVLRKLESDKFTFKSISSTEYCLPNSIKNPNPLTDELVWDEAFIGESSAPKELCLYSNGMPLTRKCLGDFLHGGNWQKLTNQELQCIEKEALSLHTKRLFTFNKVFNPNETHSVIENMTSISSHFNELIPADLFYISKAVQQLTSVTDDTAIQSANSNSATMNLNDKYNLTIILNNIMNVNENFIQLSQQSLNTTNILLDSYDNLINSLSTNYSIYSTKVDFVNSNLVSNQWNETDGTFIMRTKKIVVFITDPDRMNVSGVALVRDPNKQGNESNLLDYNVEKLYTSQSIDDILNIYKDNLEIASYFPEELINRLDEIQNMELNKTSSFVGPLKIVIKIYYNDAIFKENQRITSYKSQSKIISVSLPGHDQNLPILLPIMFKKSKSSRLDENNDVCGYWEFQPNGTSSDSSEWMQEGCEFLGVSKYDENLALCGCSHLTHFAYLIMGTYIHDIGSDSDVIITKFNPHNNALNAITLLGSSLSILGIIGIFITAFCFRVWREKASTKVLLQLSVAIALQMFLFIFFSTEKHTYTIDTPNEKRACILLGSSLHYSVLVTFAWMLITAFLQFKRYVIVLGNLKPERFFLKSFIVGWGLPLIPILVVLTIDPLLYIPKSYGICYPQGLAFYLSVLLPVAIIVVANLVIFIAVLYSIMKGGSPKVASMRKNEQSMLVAQLRVSIFLFFLLGLTWIFGLLASSEKIIFSYLFCIFATIQGFVLFLYFIVMDPITRKLWTESFRSWKTRN